jgi:hypothetical protein
MPDSDAQLDVASRFARALDEENYPTAFALLAPDCEYTVRGVTHRGPNAIVASYKGNGDEAARIFDSIVYGSEVHAAGADCAVIQFTDRIQHAGQSLTHVCEQQVTINDDGLITRIEHHDLPGERERLEAFKHTFGIHGDT